MDNIELKNSDTKLPAPPDRHYDFVVHTFGCKVNTYDTGLIQKNLKQNGFNIASDLKAKNAVHVLNTCAVTSEATKQAVRLIRKIKSKEPLATVVVTGCAAQVDTGAFENLPGADLVVANSHKGMLPHLIDQFFKGDNKQKVFKSNIFKKDDLEEGGGQEQHHTRSFLKIQDGCNSFCSFCIIPYARGKSRSLPISVLVEKINQLHKDGLQEVVLTGVHIGDYEVLEGGVSKKLEDLVEAVLQRTKISRIRLSSLEPIEVSERLLQLYQNDRLCPHFHMSIQSGDTDVLSQMKRQYGEAEVRSSLEAVNERVNSGNVFVGMDVIAGFPSETDEQFENTYKILSETPWTRLHVFPYSERPGTRAAIMPQVTLMKRKERALRLRELSLHRYQTEALKQVGSLKKVLVLNKYSEQVQGLSRDYWNVNLGLAAEEYEGFRNKEVSVKIEEVVLNGDDLYLKARVLEL
jgi:threonylcarbamoyladenosine tRNA methylthiotransferase MtaB